MNLRHGAGLRDLLKDIEGPSVLIADELTPSLAAQLDWTRVRGFAVDAGSRTYHTAILARSLKVPAVVGLHDAVGAHHRGHHARSSTARRARCIIAPDAGRDRRRAERASTRPRRRAGPPRPPATR